MGQWFLDGTHSRVEGIGLFARPSGSRCHPAILDSNGAGIKVVARLKDNLPELPQSVERRFSAQPSTRTCHDGKERIEIWDVVDLAPWEILHWDRDRVRVIRYRQHRSDGCVIQADWLTNFSLREAGNLSLYHIAKSRWEIENRSFNDAKSRYGLGPICHHEQNRILLAWPITFLAPMIERLYRIQYLRRGMHRRHPAGQHCRLLWLSLPYPGQPNSTRTVRGLIAGDAGCCTCCSLRADTSPEGNPFPKTAARQRLKPPCLQQAPAAPTPLLGYSRFRNRCSPDARLRPDRYGILARDRCSKRCDCQRARARVLRFVLNGPVAQLGARFHGMEEVVSSNLTRSTKTISYTLRKLRPHVAVSAPPIIPTQGPKKVQTRSKSLFSTDACVVWIGPRFLPA
jgi:hypothetical protein